MITTYNPAWKTAFENIAVVLKAALVDTPMDIQHVGSTAIPGLAAKPILDIDIIIHQKDLLHSIEKKLMAMSYFSKGMQGIKGRYAFRQSTPATPQNISGTLWMAHHLYVCYADSLALKNHLLFLLQPCLAPRTRRHAISGQDNRLASICRVGKARHAGDSIPKFHFSKSERHCLFSPPRLFFF